jgi:hypothetical protein
MSYTPDIGNAVTLEFSGSYTPTVGSSVILDFTSSLVYASARFGQVWSLAAPVFADAIRPQKWSLSALVFADCKRHQAWSLSALQFIPSGFYQAWQQQAPDFTNAQHDQQWGLVSYQTDSAHISQRWALEAPAVWTKVVSSTAYLLSLEQGEDSTEIPMANFSGQFRSGEPSYIQCGIPNAWEWADTVAAYAAQEDTEIVINAGYRWSDDSYTTQEIARVTLRNVRYDYGARSASVSLDGVDTRTNPAPKAITLTGASYINQDSDGRLRYRVTPQFDVRPGDTVTVGNDTFVVGELSYQVNASGASMEVAELIESV